VGSRFAGAGLLLSLAFPVVATGQPTVLSPAYTAAVERYVSGDREGAVTAVYALAERELRKQVDTLRSLSKRARACAQCADSIAWREAPLPAALMLHTDASLRREEGRLPARAHESVAAALAQLMSDDDPARRAFARRWYLVAAGLAHADNRWEDALAWARRGLDAFPGAAELLLAIGSIEESVNLLAAPRLLAELLDPSTSQARAGLTRYRDARQGLERARRALRDALAAEPSLDEARLRLGRIAWRLGEPAEARAALDEVLLRTNAARGTAHLAHLFTGRLHEDAGRLEEAARAYEAALALDANGQAARIALSHVRLRLGDAAAARSEVAAALAPAGRRRHPDPFWVYAAGVTAGLEEQLEALRREAGS
jgi:tetratricopeptide (TPR) repeat protein